MTVGRVIAVGGALILEVAVLWLASLTPVEVTATMRPPVHRVLDSVIRIQVEINGQAGACTAFSIREVPGQFITANHCAQGKVEAGGVEFMVRHRDADEDLALIETAWGLPALEVGREPRVGDELKAIGYPVASPNPMIFPSTYQGAFITPLLKETARTVTVGNTIPGMSGGPIVDKRGEVVSVVLGGGHPDKIYQAVGFGAQFEAVRRLFLRARLSGAP